MIVLDTHTLLWMDRDDVALGRQSRVLIEQAWATSSVAVSAISFWESALLAQHGRIELPLAIETWRMDLLRAGIQEIVLDGQIALLACSLDYTPCDPADRFIIASALYHGALLLTADSQILNWKSNLERHDARI